jgi:hypothetical protein
MNSNTRIDGTQCSLVTWFFLRNISVDTLHKGDTEDNNNNNNNNNNTGTSDMRTMNSNTRIDGTQCSLVTWFFLRNISVDTLYKGATEDDDDDEVDYDDDNINNNNNTNDMSGAYTRST